MQPLLQPRDWRFLSSIYFKFFKGPDEGTIFSQLAPHPLASLTVSLLPVIHLFLPIYLCPLYVFAATQALPLLHPSPSQASAPFLPRQISLGEVALPPV